MFCVSRKGGTGGGGWCHLQGDMHMLAAMLAPWFGPGGPILSRCLTTESADYCMLVDKWVRLRSRILLVMARSGLVFSFRVRAWTR